MGVFSWGIRLQLFFEDFDEREFAWELRGILELLEFIFSSLLRHKILDKRPWDLQTWGIKQTGSGFGAGEDRTQTSSRKWQSAHVGCFLQIAIVVARVGLYRCQKYCLWHCTGLRWKQRLSMEL